MEFAWAWARPALVAVPLVLVAYAWIVHRKRRFAVRYASLSLIREAQPRRSRWRRLVPVALLLVTMATLVLALARPQVAVSIPRDRTTIMLALDVSRSMCSNDVSPNRLTAAEKAARRFVEDQPEARIGLVAFAGSAQILVPPTTDKSKVVHAINNLTTGPGTAIGSALLASIDALARVNHEIAPSTVKVNGAAGRGGSASAGKYEPDIVVLLTDGASNTGVDPLVAAGQVADRRVRVYTIGFGTTNPGSLVCPADQLGASGFGQPFGGFGGNPGAGTFGGGPGGDRTRFLAADEATLKAISQATGGEFSSAQNAGQLASVFRSLPSRVVTQTEQHELGVYFVGFGALLAVAALGLSLWWNRYP
jgi:Ca-activated chloride channel family protein